MLWERIRKLEGRNEDEGPSKSEEKVSRYICIEWKLGGKCEKDGTNGEQYATNDSTDSRSIFIKYCADGKSHNVRCNGSGCEHEVESGSIQRSAIVNCFNIGKRSVPDFLLIACPFPVMLHFLCIGAELSVDPLFNQYWFYCGIPKDDPSGEQTVDDGEGDLYCNESELVFSRRKSVSSIYISSCSSRPRKRPSVLLSQQVATTSPLD